GDHRIGKGTVGCVHREIVQIKRVGALEDHAIGAHQGDLALVGHHIAIQHGIAVDAEGGTAVQLQRGTGLHFHVVYGDAGGGGDHITILHHHAHTGAEAGRTGGAVGLGAPDHVAHVAGGAAVVHLGHLVAVAAQVQVMDAPVGRRAQVRTVVPVDA